MEKDPAEVMEDIAIGFMTEEDIPFVIELERQSFSIPWSAQSFQNVIQDEFSYGLVGIAGNQLIAYAVFGAIEDYAELWNIAVEEQYRGMGIGNMMLNHVIKLCRELGVSSLFLQVRESNLTAQNLYKKNDFTFVMVQKNYYHSPVENALVFRLDIE
jgi:ribosomal-protein-alanine N-acetyltransferase